MLRRLSARERFEILVQQFEPLIRAAFMEAIDDIRSNIVLRRIVERLERGDINGAIRALNLDEAAFRPLEEAIRQAYTGGGVAAVEQMPALRDPEGHQIVVRFDTRNIEAETWLRNHSASLVTNIVADQEEGIRVALSEGLAQGQNPTRTALNVVGRVNRATGRREGGIIGLTAQQSGYVDNARRELLSGDPEALRNYLARGRRDKRFDKTVMAAIKAGKPLPVAPVEKIVGRYSDGLLKLRGDVIALNETMTALNESKVEAFRQAIGKGAVSERVLTKTWNDSRDNRVRHTHREMHGQRVAFNDRFVSPSGALLAYPHDPSAPTAETLGCRCWMDVKVNFLAGLK
jgi:hypothetical protein